MLGELTFKRWGTKAARLESSTNQYINIQNQGQMVMTSTQKDSRMNGTDWLQNVTCTHSNVQTAIQLELIFVAARETSGRGTKADEKDAPPA